MNKTSRNRAPLLVLSRHTLHGLPSAPAFALIRLTQETLSRLLLLEQLRLEHQIMWLIVDDIEVEWDQTEEPIEITWVTLHRRRFALEGITFDGTATYGTRRFRVDQLRQVLTAKCALHMSYPHRWTQRQAGRFQLSVIAKLVERGYLDEAAANDYRRSLPAALP